MLQEKRKRKEGVDGENERESKKEEGRRNWGGGKKRGY